MVKVPKALEVSHLPLLSLVPVRERTVSDLKQFSSSFFARLEAVVDNERRAGEREMLEQVQRWIELQKAGVGTQ